MAAALEELSKIEELEVTAAGVGSDDISKLQLLLGVREDIEGAFGKQEFARRVEAAWMSYGGARSASVLADQLQPARSVCGGVAPAGR